MKHILRASPFSPRDVAGGACSLGEPRTGETAFYWLQSVPEEGGRNTVMRLDPGGTPQSLVPAGCSVRSRVNEYGGGAWTLAGEEVWFVNDSDQGLFRAGSGGVEKIFGASGLALADLEWDSRRRCVYAVAEELGDRPRQGIAGIGEDGRLTWLAQGADFYAAPRLSPDGGRLVWLEWSEPDMPWDSTRLMQIVLGESGARGDPVQLAGEPGESLAQPEWSPRGVLYVASDREGGYWNLHRLAGTGLVPVRRARAECARPAFVFAQRLYALTGADGWILAEVEDGLWRCLEEEAPGASPRPLLPGLTDVQGVAAGPAGTMIVGGGPDRAPTVFVRAHGESDFRPVARSLELELDPGFVSRPRPLHFPTGDGATAHALYFPPAHPDLRDPGPVPVRVRCHGGPTSAASSALEPKTLYWTSRGFGVVELNYRGSTGYGRAYREALYGQWGVADVEDARALGRALLEQDVAEAGRLVIAGGSAGGLTVLGALAGKSDYAAGASFYGVADLTSLTESTLRFEAHYGEKLVGPWPGARDVYEQRSPINHADRIGCPVIFFQGLDDPVVPPQQSQRMAGVLASRGLPVVLETFAGERHGFRRPETVARTLAAELAFYCRLLGLESAEPLASLEWLGETPN